MRVGQPPNNANTRTGPLSPSRLLKSATPGSSLRSRKDVAFPSVNGEACFFSLEGNALPLQHFFLEVVQVAVFGKGDLSLRVEDTLPWNVGAVWKVMKCVTDEPRLTIEFAQIGNRAIR